MGKNSPPHYPIGKYVESIHPDELFQFADPFPDDYVFGGPYIVPPTPQQDQLFFFDYDQQIPEEEPMDI